MIIDFNGNKGGGGGGEYVLPKATATKLGGIKVGENLEIDANGVLSAVGGSEGKKQFVLEVISSEEGHSVSQEAYDEAAAYLKANGLDSADVLLNFGGGTVVELVSKETAGEEGELFVGYGFYFQDAIILEGTEVLMEPISEGGEGGDYKIVDSLPDWANEGTMIYLTNEQYEYETVPVDGCVFDMPEVPEGVSFATMAGCKHYLPDIGVDEVQGEIKIENGVPYMTSWFTTGVEYKRDGKINTMVTPYFTLVSMFNDEEKRFYVGVKDAQPDYIFSVISDGEQYSNTPISEITGINKIIKPGNYLRKNGMWIPAPIIPTLKQGTPFTEDEYNAVVNAYQEGKLYKVLANVDGNLWECHITKVGNDWFEASSSAYYNGGTVTGLIRFHTWGNDDGFERMEISRDMMEKKLVECGTKSMTIPAGTEYVFDSDNWREQAEPDIFNVPWYGYTMLGLEIWGRALIGPQRNLVMPGTGWKYAEADGAKIWVKCESDRDDHYIITARQSNCEVNEENLNTYGTANPDQPEINVAARLIERSFNNTSDDLGAITPIRSLDVDYMVVGGALQPKMLKLTQAEYDALETKYDNTLYIIVD